MLVRSNVHRERPRLTVVLKRGSDVRVLQRVVEFGRVDLADVVTNVPASLPIIGHAEGDIAELANGPQHFESGEFDRLGCVVARLLGGEVDDDRTLLFFF